MPEYLSPGIYVEEIDAGPKPIEGVSTSTAGAVGVTVRGATTGRPDTLEGKPELVTSFPEFVRKFGGYVSEPDPALVNQWALDSTEGGRWWQFPLAVKGFFDNGGQRLYVKRVFSSTATHATATFAQGVISEITQDASATEKTLRVRHLIGIAEGTNVTLYVNGLPSGAFQVTKYSGSGTLELNNAIGQDVKGGRDFIESTIDPRQVVLAPAAGAPDPTLKVEAKSHGDWGGNETSETGIKAGTGLTVRVRPMVGATLRIIAAASPGDQTIKVWNASQLYKRAIIELDNGTQKDVLTVDSVNGDVVKLSAVLTHALKAEDRLRVIEAEVTARYLQNHVIETEETFPNLHLINDGSLSYLVTQVNERSSLINLTAGEGFVADTLQDFPSVPPAAPPEPAKFWMDLKGGADNLTGLTVDDFVGVDGGSGNRTGIQAFEDIDEISICLAPGIWSSTVHSGLIQHCELLRDRFAILDPQDGLSIEEIRTFREVIDTKYAALYYPWLEVRDPSVKRNVYVAPSGHMAGIYARVDVERGVHKAPANEVIRGITKISQDVSKREQDLLNPRNINALRFFPGRGNRVWGARTLSSDSAWKYINVRRLFIFVEESIDEGTQFVVFEPNDEPLWARVRQTITNFLTTVWRSGALQGTKPDEAFFVKCDRSTMTQDDIDNGRLICVIGIAPVKPAEFVIFRIQQKTQESQTA
jgi:phage tail sheath protein FI